MKFILNTFILFLISTTPTMAVCPVCTIAVGAGLGISRQLGIDDLVTSIWIGGLVLSMSLWFANIVTDKRWPIPSPQMTSVVFFYTLVLATLKIFGVIGIPGNSLFGIDKLILGISMGSVVFYLGSLLDKTIKKKNDGKVLFYYQKVIIPLSLLIVASLITSSLL